MRTQLEEEEKEAAKAQYEELLAALKVINKAHKNMLFEIMPNQSLFDRMYKNDSIIPLHIEFKSKNTGATFTLKNKFPNSWVITVPTEATKEEKSCMRDVMLETIAHPISAHKDYEPKLIAIFSEDTPEEDIFEFIEAAQTKGIKVTLLIGEIADYGKIGEAHSQKTKGEEMMEKYNSEKGRAFQCGP